MKRTAYIYIIGVAAALCTACEFPWDKSAPSEDELGMEALSEARRQMGEGRYDDARATILRLRKEHPTALDARRQGIITMDSIEMLAAEDSLREAQDAERERLSVKVEFFKRKLQHDEANK